MNKFGDPASPKFARDNTIVIGALAALSILLTFAVLNGSYVFHYFFDTKLGMLELLGSALLIANVYLLAKQKLVNYWFGLAGVLVFGYIFMEVQLYSDMYLQWAFYAPLQIIGFVIWMWGPRIWDWLHNLYVRVTLMPDVWKVDLSPVDSMRIKTMSPFLYMITAVLIGAAMLWWIPKMEAAGAHFVVADALIMWLSIAASILMLRKYLENWVLWITVDIIAVPVYYMKGLYVTSGLYVIFFFLASYGLWTWYQDWKKQNETTGQHAWIP